MNRKSFRIMALIGAVGFAACGETSDLVMDELSEAEAQDLAGVVMLATFNSTGSVPQPAGVSGPQAVPFSFAAEFDADVECPLGGLANVAASLEVSGDTESEAGSVEYSMTQIHDACVVMSESGRTFTLWGAPSMNVAFTVENNGLGVVEWAGSAQGSIDWMTDGREGTCAVQMEFDGRQEGEAALAAEMLGTVCGFSISQAVSIG